MDKFLQQKEEKKLFAAFKSLVFQKSKSHKSRLLNRNWAFKMLIKKCIPYQVDNLREVKVIKLDAAFPKLWNE